MLQDWLHQHLIEVLSTTLVLISTTGVFVYRRKKRHHEPKPFHSETGEDTNTETAEAHVHVEKPKTGADRWTSTLRKTREKWFGLSHGEKIQRAHLEEALLGADVGFKCSQELLTDLDFAKDWSELQRELSKRMSVKFESVSSGEISKSWPVKKGVPHVILVVGVNGVGKTTSIAKLARELKMRGNSVLLAAGDTFRAAAAEQLAAWAEKLDIPCIKGGENSDSSAVLFDAIKAGEARRVDFVICDSAGRLHNNDQLMENLNKNKRVIEKAKPSAPHDVVLVLDANTGQNMLNQGKKFLSLGLSALILTKIDGSAKGGAVLPLVQELQLPIVRLGVGEGEEDLLEFDPASFSGALVGTPA
jgi:fused signal recognition particle receptor